MHCLGGGGLLSSFVAHRSARDKVVGQVKIGQNKAEEFKRAATGIPFTPCFLRAN
jgi:hypothetical protein